jgi:cytosolic carboxypeptidase protein 2/3
MNPTAKKTELRFDSNFESGNLDLAVSVADNEFDLYLRVDSNTKGHACWFFFKVSNFLDRQKAKFNIVNFSRS